MTQNFLLFDNVLGVEKNREVYELALKKSALYAPSRTSPNKHYPDWRKSNVLYHQDFTSVKTLMEQIVLARLPDVFAQLEIPEFKVSDIEVQLTSHNDGEYYHWHTDNGNDKTKDRVVTFVYYFHCNPKRFSGGELVLYNEKQSEIIEPLNDRMVMFDAGKKHEVKAVSCESKQFKNGRFTLNGWLRRSAIQNQHYFDAKIFSFPCLNSGGRAVNQAAGVSAGNQKVVSIQNEHPVRPSVSDHERIDEHAQKAFAYQLLQAKLYRKSANAKNITIKTKIEQRDFFENFYYLNRPVLLKTLMNRSRAVKHWSPRYFAKHYGSVPITITDNRAGNANYESNFIDTLRTVELRDLINRIECEPESNDYYLVARNGFFDQPGLMELREELEPPENIIRVQDKRAGTCKLWLGPKGTVTPLHHDLHSILFCQIYGKKHFKLISPLETHNIYVDKGFYSEVDPEDIDLNRFPNLTHVNILEVTVDAGDVLFLPVGWWHWVKSLDVSISATFCSFNEPEGNTALALPRQI